MVTSNVIHRVFHIRVGQCTGTAFAIDFDKKQYIVTAAHILMGTTPTQIEVFRGGSWSQLNVAMVGFDGAHDVAVLSPGTEMVPPSLPLPAESKGCIYGQELFFLGFPYGLVGSFSFGPSGYPLPFVKRAALSMIGPDRFFLDGINNVGFSGGPVVRQDQNHQFQVVALISGYISAAMEVKEGGEMTSFSVQYNTGIIDAPLIDHALALIALKPCGLLLT